MRDPRQMLSHTSLEKIRDKINGSIDVIKAFYRVGMPSARKNPYISVAIE